MSYIGKGIKSVSSANITVDTMIGDGVVNTLALSQSGVESVKDVSVYYQGVAQVPNVDYTLTASTVTFTTIPAAGMKVVAVTRGDSIRDNVNDNSASGTSFADNSITDSKVIGLDASKLTGALPAMDGSALTNTSLPTAPLTSSASDPAVDTNGTLGDIFVNTTTGQMFVLTDATTDENVWTNAGNGDGNITYVPFSYQGTAYGYTVGGHLNYSAIQRYSFTSNGNSTTTGNLILTTFQNEASQSATDGYVFRGYDWGSSSVRRMEIQKFSFASGGDAVDTGFVCLAQGTEYSQAYASTSTDGNYCYLAGGHGNVHGTRVTSIQSFSFTTNADTIDVGDLVSAMSFGWGWSYDNSYGYHAGGYVTDNWNKIHKFSLAQSGITASILASELTVARRGCYGQGVSSTTHGYVVGGQGSALATSTNVIDRMAFATDTGMVDHGDLHTGTCLLYTSPSPRDS